MVFIFVFEEVAKSMFGTGYEEEIEQYVNFVFHEYDADNSGGLDLEGRVL